MFRERERYPEEKRSKHYLREEFAERLSKGPVHYKLQLQLHQVSPSDRPHVLHAGRYWDESTHPWMDLAEVMVTTMLPSDVTERTRFNVGNAPPSLGLVGPPESIHDFKCIPHIRIEVYKRCQQMRSWVSASEKPKELSTYLIQVETGDRKYAGTDATISITLTGEYHKDKCVTDHSGLEQKKVTRAHPPLYFRHNLLFSTCNKLPSYFQLSVTTWCLSWFPWQT